LSGAGRRALVGHFAALREIIDSVPSSLDALPSTRGGEAARQTHGHVDNVRHGTTTVFAPLEVATGKISADACYPRHSNVEFLAFLRRVAKTHPRVRLHVICDNYGTHTHPNVRAWLAKNPRITLHFTPTSCSSRPRSRRSRTLARRPGIVPPQQSTRRPRAPDWPSRSAISAGGARR
jgi:transposase